MTLKKDLRESQNVVNEKEEEMYMLNERVEEMVRWGGCFQVHYILSTSLMFFCMKTCNFIHAY